MQTILTSHECATVIKPLHKQARRSLLCHNT